MKKNKMESRGRSPLAGFGAEPQSSRRLRTDPFQTLPEFFQGPWVVILGVDEVFCGFEVAPGLGVVEPFGVDGGEVVVSGGV